MKKKITIIFICYNCGADIAKNIVEINDMEFNQYEVEFIVFDNASSDNSLEIIEKIDVTNLSLIVNNTNLGFGRACNEGLGKSHSHYYLLLNPDIKLCKNSIVNLLSFAEQYPHAGIWGGVTLNEKGGADGKNAWRESTLWGFICWAVFLTRLFSKIRLFSPDDYNGVIWDKVNNVDAITGCFFLIEAELWKKLHGFDERFFMYCEEIDLCYRARELGAQPMVTDQATIIHYGGGTTTSENKINLLYKSKLIYFKKHWFYSKYCVARVTLVIAAFLRGLLYRFTDKNKANIWMKLLINQFYWKV